MVGIHMVEPRKFATQFNSRKPRPKTLSWFLLSLPHPIMALVGMTCTASARINIMKLGRRETNQGYWEKVRTRVRDKQGNRGILEVMREVLSQGAMLNAMFEYAELCWEFREVKRRKATSECSDLTTFQSKDGNKSPVETDWKESVQGEKMQTACMDRCLKKFC